MKHGGSYGANCVYSIHGLYNNIDASFDNFIWFPEEDFRSSANIPTRYAFINTT